MKRSLTILCALAFVGAVMTTGCDKKKAEPAKAEPAATVTKKEEPKKEEAKKEEAKKEAPAAGAIEKTGVKECDDYLTKYTACLDGKVPEAARAAMKKGIVTMAAAWKKAAATDAGKKAMATACTNALEAAKKGMAAYKCEW
ncbi:MAG: hypothetical protein JRH20_14920 [Deltaproteobacteria bacterium]|nr:hypothetical protein [Deltaproteobacteria bacterium]